MFLTSHLAPLNRELPFFSFLKLLTIADEEDIQMFVDKKQKHCLSSLFIMVSLLFKQRMTYCSFIIYSNSCQSLIVEWFIVIKFQISCGRIWWYLGLMVIIIPYEWCIDISPLYLIYLVNPIFRYPVVISWDLMGSKPHPTIHFQVKSRQRQEAPLVFVRRE